MGRGLLLLWLVAPARASERRKNKKKALKAAAGRPAAMTLEARPLKYKDDAVGSYAKTWATPNTNRSGIHFLERFGAIDVGCTYDVESAGAGAIMNLHAIEPGRPKFDFHTGIDDARDQKRGLCKYAGSWREYLEKLGVAGRDTAKHPWGE